MAASRSTGGAVSSTAAGWPIYQHNMNGNSIGGSSVSPSSTQHHQYKGNTLSTQSSQSPPASLLSRSPGAGASGGSAGNSNNINNQQYSNGNSPTQSIDIGNTLHSTLNSLSLNPSSYSSQHQVRSPGEGSSAKPMLIRTSSSSSSSGGVSQQQQQQQQQSVPQVSAIGSGRTGTSPPSRMNGSLPATTFDGKESTINGGGTSSSISPTTGLSHLPQLHQSHVHTQTQQRHTPSHSLPWPSYASLNGHSSNGSSHNHMLPPPLAGGSSTASTGLNGSSSHNYHHRNSLNEGNNNASQNDQFLHNDGGIAPYRTISISQHSANDDRTSTTTGKSPHDELPDLSSHAEESASSRFSLSSQPQFNLDHAQLAKSREQRDLDDVDSGQRASATLWMGDLEGWMDETYIKRCVIALGWDRDENGGQTVQTSVKMIKGASSTSGYCFITFPTSAHAQSVLAHFSKQPPMLMPGSERTFKLNWATGLPGVQPKWEGEYSIFVGDLGREVTEGELVALFTPLFMSTKSAKIMYDPATGLSRGYGFVRFGDEKDMTRSLALGQNTSGSGLSLRGRTLRISEASGSGGSRNRTQSSEGESSVNGASKNPRELHIKVPGNNGLGANLLSPNATGFSIPLASPSSPGPVSPSYLSSQPQSSNSTGVSSPLSPSADPTNTTVFVGGLPASIGEDTLRSFFQHFGEITYVKIPPNKGCGFVQFLRRADAELAIAKMHDFPIHGKSRIRLSWGRSQGDKQVEHVRKLATALNVPFEAVWRMVQGQDNSTIKQIASAVGGNAQARGGARHGVGGGAGTASPADSENARAGLARLAGLKGSIGPGQAGLGPASGHGIPFGDMPHTHGPIFDGMQPPLGMMPGVGPPPAHMPGLGHVPGPHDPEAYAFRPAVPSALSPAEFGFAGPPRTNDSGPYSRVSPSAFAPMSTSNLSGQSQQTVPLSSPSQSGPYDMQGNHHHQQPMQSFSSNFDPYTPVSIPSPVGGMSGNMASTNHQQQQQQQGVSNATFDPRQWRSDQSGLSGDLSAPSPAFSGGLPDFLNSSINGRF